MAHLLQSGAVMKTTTSSSYLITAFAGGVALVCLALGFRLLGPDLPAPVAAWMQDDRIRNGLVLALGGALVSFLLGSGFMLAARQSVQPMRRKGRRRDGPDPRPPFEALISACDRIGRGGQELANLADQGKTNSESLNELAATVARLRETLDQTEEIVRQIDEVGRTVDQAAESKESD